MKLALSIVLGSFLCALTTALLLTYLQPTNWVSQGSTLPLNNFEPTYVEPIAPELVGVLRHAPSTGNGSFMLYHVNVGVDMMTYSYGSNNFPNQAATWDPALSETPTVVRLSRFQFGWPFRMLSYDDITTGLSTTNPLVAAYHQKAYSLAGKYRGLDRPAWLPRFIPLYRVPIAIDWAALILNVVAWSAITYAILSIRPMLRALAIRRRRRRGLCIKCKYPLEGLSQCPECGTAAHKQSTFPTPEG